MIDDTAKKIISMSVFDINSDSFIDANATLGSYSNLNTGIFKYKQELLSIISEFMGKPLNPISIDSEPKSIINVFEDGANGSYYVEDLTQQIVSKAWNYFIDIEDNGGYLAELELGRIQKDIYQQAIAEQKWVEEGKIKLIGVNLYPTLEIKKRAEELYLETKIKPVRWAEAYE